MDHVQLLDDAELLLELRICFLLCTTWISHEQLVRNGDRVFLYFRSGGKAYNYVSEIM